MPRSIPLRTISVSAALGIVTLATAGMVPFSGGRTDGHPSAPTSVGKPPDPASLPGFACQGSHSKSIRAGCTPERSCTDMYVDCQEKGPSCIRQVTPKKTLCAYCRDDCQAKEPYKYSECYQCGFE